MSLLIKLEERGGKGKVQCGMGGVGIGELLEGFKKGNEMVRFVF